MKRVLEPERICGNQVDNIQQSSGMLKSFFILRYTCVSSVVFVFGSNS